MDVQRSVLGGVLAVLCPVNQVGPGDMITEADTPGGPWYLVVAADRSTGSLIVRDDGCDVELPVDDWETQGVLRRTGATTAS